MSLPVCDAALSHKSVNVLNLKPVAVSPQTHKDYTGNALDNWAIPTKIPQIECKAKVNSVLKACTLILYKEFII